MTREEVIDFCYMSILLEPANEDIFNYIIKVMGQEPCCNCIEFKRYAKEIGFEIEQEPVLDKIRAEIEGIIQEETVVDNSGDEYERTISKLDPDDVLQIIDKYKAESEEKE